ncbi:MAG: hypothetical protein AB8H03_06620 [Saprospiraceae bacterium]
MKKLLLFFSILLLFNLMSCENDDDNSEPMAETVYQELGIVTGLDFFDENGAAIGQWKSPNHNPGEVSTYPIPNNGNVFVYSPNKIVRIWLIPTTCTTDSTIADIPTLSQDLTYTITELENVQVKDIPLTDFNSQVALNFNDVSAGFYKLFFELESGDLFWQNLYIDPAASSFPTFDFLDNLCD